MLDSVKKVVEETPKERRTAYLIFLAIIWCFGIYLLFYGKLQPLLELTFITSTSLAFFGYSCILLYLSPSKEKQPERNKLVAFQVVLVLMLVGLIILNLLFAYSIHHHGKSPIASVLLCLSAILWLFHKWTHRFIGVVTLFLCGYLIVELEG